jgi:hypothetical protein
MGALFPPMKDSSMGVARDETYMHIVSRASRGDSLQVPSRMNPSPSTPRCRRTFNVSSKIEQWKST